TDFSGGGYFYLDQSNEAVIPTTNHQIWVVGETSGPTGPGFSLQRAYDLSASMSSEDQLISALPDWNGRIWFATTKGVVGTVDAAPDGSPAVTWRQVYPNIGIVKPGQTEDGSGTTPNLMGTEYVAITDNADPMDVVVYRRAKQVTGSRVVCSVPVFSKGSSSTDNSLIGTGRSIIVENNYGYTGPTSTTGGASTAPGIERVDINDNGTGCSPVWYSGERAPSAVPKLSLADGLVYAYTKP